ncbi:MAG: hypothetical protein QGD90_10925 [Candidatus Hydrogenedentes bacterium]|nr:hypothetical protein [Candidatus Hydrogenedentota bacterium]
MAWPMPYEECRQPGIDIATRYLREVAAVDDDFLRDALLLVSLRVVVISIWKMEAAQTAEAAHRQGMSLDVFTEELTYIVGQIESLPAPHTAMATMEVPRPRFQRLDFLRRLKWTAKWTPLHRLLPVVLSSNFEAISLSPLLRRQLEMTGETPVYHMSEDTLWKARKHATGELPSGWWELVDGLIERLVNCSGLSEPYRGRLLVSLLQDARFLVRGAGMDLLALRSVRRLPERVWSGTGSQYSSRCMGLEVLRRGGEVVRFCHGGTYGLMRPYGQIANLELSVSSELVASSEAQADLIRRSGDLDYVASYRSTRITATDGEPTIGDFVETLPRRPRARRAKVVYVLAVLAPYGAAPAAKIANNILYLDFNYHVLEALRSLPIDVVAKPHPGGVFGGRRHPLSDGDVPGDTPFERVVADADVIVMDQAHSTAFWQMMSTDRGIVYIDCGITRFDPKIWPDVERRCQVIRAYYDDANRFRIDREELADAIATAARRTVDPAPFRQLHMSDNAAV